jgi:hypothetical protein
MASGVEEAEFCLVRGEYRGEGLLRAVLGWGEFAEVEGSGGMGISGREVC